MRNFRPRCFSLEFILVHQENWFIKTNKKAALHLKLWIWFGIFWSCCIGLKLWPYIFIFLIFLPLFYWFKKNSVPVDLIWDFLPPVDLLWDFSAPVDLIGDFLPLLVCFRIFLPLLIWFGIFCPWWFGLGFFCPCWFYLGFSAPDDLLWDFSVLVDLIWETSDPDDLLWEFSTPVDLIWDFLPLMIWSGIFLPLLICLGFSAPFIYSGFFMPNWIYLWFILPPLIDFFFGTISFNFDFVPLSIFWGHFLSTGLLDTTPCTMSLMVIVFWTTWLWVQSELSISMDSRGKAIT